MKRRRALLVAGGLSLAIALLHIVIIFVGASAYRYFGAGEEMARQAESGSAFPALLTAGITAFFALFAYYGFAGAGVVPRPPLLRTGLLAIGAIYTVRGLLLVPQLLSYLNGLMESKELVFSFVSLCTGLLYLIGTLRAWPLLYSQ